MKAPKLDAGRSMEDSMKDTLELDWKCLEQKHPDLWLGGQELGLAFLHLSDDINCWV